jgi:multidrug efflux system membrane fusion protein
MPLKPIPRSVRKYAQQHPWYSTVFVILLAVGIYFLFFSGQKKSTGKPPILVAVETVRIGSIPLYQNTIGTVIPTSSVVVKTQINGRLTGVFFEEGKLVKKGQLLAQIDPQTYEALLKQTQGQLIKDQAFLDNARTDLKRYEELIKNDSVSRQILDTQRALVNQYEGIVKSDEGLVQNATVNLQYCKIISEIDGVIGLRQVDAGNLVSTSDLTPITTINAISPINVIFSLAEDFLPQVQNSLKKQGELVAEAFDKKGETLLDTGKLIAMDSQIDTTTGTVKLKAVFKNENLSLFPNQFVNVRLKVDMINDTLIVSNSAIQMGKNGNYVYVVDGESKAVSAKLVTIKTSVGEESAVSGDLTAGQTIVVQGQDKLTDGTVVAPANKKESEASGVPITK